MQVVLKQATAGVAMGLTTAFIALKLVGYNLL